MCSGFARAQITAVSLSGTRSPFAYLWFAAFISARKQMAPKVPIMVSDPIAASLPRPTVQSSFYCVFFICERHLVGICLQLFRGDFLRTSVQIWLLDFQSVCTYFVWYICTYVYVQTVFYLCIASFCQKFRLQTFYGKCSQPQLTVLLTK